MPTDTPTRPGARQKDSLWTIRLARAERDALAAHAAAQGKSAAGLVRELLIREGVPMKP